MVGGEDAKGSGDGGIYETSRLRLDAGGLVEAGVLQQAIRALGDDITG